VAHLVGTLWTALPNDQRVDPVIKTKEFPQNM